jgi:hypothetical protein
MSEMPGEGTRAVSDALELAEPRFREATRCAADRPGGAAASLGRKRPAIAGLLGCLVAVTLSGC